MSTQPEPAEVCPLCSHAVNEHGGGGCCVGWFQDGPLCHCPLDSKGAVAVGCQYIDCNATPTHSHPDGTFYCADHAALERRAVAIPDVPTWSEA
jgi:hypothetical protein